MATITPNKTDSVSVLTHQLATHPVTIVGSTQDVSTKRAVLIFMYHGYIEATADTNPGKFKIQVRPDAGSGSVLEHWITIAEYLVKGTTPSDEALTATEPSGETVLAIASTTGLAAEDQVYILDAGTLADSEWGELQEIVTDTSATLMDGLTTGKDSSDSIFNDASRFVCALNLEFVKAYRVVWSHEGVTGANGHVKALAVTYDSDNNA